MIYLIYPPFFEVDHQYLALPLLKGHLKNKNIESIVIDMNLAYFKHVISPKYTGYLLKQNKQRLSEFESMPYIAGQNAGQFLQTHIDFLKLSYINDNLDAASKVMSDFNLFSNDKEYNSAMELYLNRFKVEEHLFNPTKFSIGAFVNQNIPLISEQWGNFLKDETQNPIRKFTHTYFSRNTGANINKSGEPTIIGLSVVDSDQVLPALTIIDVLREFYPKTFFVIGGPFFTKFYTLIQTDNTLFDYVDGIIMGEGETPLEILYKTIITHGDLNNVPNLFHHKMRSIGNILPDIKLVGSSAKQQALPDFSDTPPQQYLSPIPVLPILSSRGCYWNRCAFCSHSYVFRKQYDVRRAEAVFNEMTAHYKKYGVSHFAFGDESISPAFVRKLSTLIVNSKIPLFWTGEIRFEPAFNEELLTLAYAGGLRMIVFGLESASPSLLKKINKGISIKTVQKVLNLCLKKKITPHLWLIAGFPDETFDEAMENIRFLRKNKRISQNPDFSAGLNRFILARNSAMWKTPERYGITKVNYTSKEYRAFDPFISPKALKPAYLETIFSLYENWEQNLPVSIRQTGRVYNLLRSAHRDEIDKLIYYPNNSPFKTNKISGKSRFDLINILQNSKNQSASTFFRARFTPPRQQIVLDPTNGRVFFTRKKNENTDEHR